MSWKKWLGYVLVAAAVVATIFFPPAGYLGKFALFFSAVGGSMLLNQVAKKEMAEQLAKAQNVTAGLQANTRSGQAVVPYITGRQRVGGNILYMKSAGANNKDLYVVYGLGEGEIDAIEEVWINDMIVWEASQGRIPGVTISELWFDFDWRPGTYNQTHFSQISAIDPDFEDRYKHTAVAMCHFVYNQDVYQGLPQVNFVIRGRKMYDPRDTLTKWTQTGPLIFRDVWTSKRFGCGISASKLDDTAIGTEATYCEQSISRAANPITAKQFGSMGRGDLHQGTSLGYYGGALPFNATLPWGTPCPTTISINFCGVETYTDNGAGVLTGNLGGAGTVNYSTRAVSITSTGGAPADYNAVEVNYRDGWRTLVKKLYYLAVKPGTVSFSSADETVTDNGAGVLTGSLGGSGTINYTTGNLSFTFKLSVPRGDNVVIQYQSDSSTRFETNWFAISGQAALDALRELLSQFRGMLIRSGNVYRLMIDKPGATVASYRAGAAENSGDNIDDGSFAWHVAGISEIPTRLRAKWIDPMENWKVKDYLVDLSGIGSERREITLEFYSCTRIDVVERLALTHAALIQQDVKCNFKTNLASLVREPGDIVDVTTPSTGWSGKKFRLNGVDDEWAGEKVALSLVAYADACYIDDPQTVSISPPALPTGFDQTAPPPQVTGLTLTEFWRLMNDGTYTSWIRIAFTIPSNYAYYDGFEIYMRRSDESADWRWIGETKTNTFEWGPVRENVTYSFKIISRNVYGVRYYPNGPVAGIKPMGKTGTPTAPTFNATTSTFTDRVVLNWNPIADKDLGNYEVRTDLNWGNATNRVYLGKATSFWMQAAAASYTFYLKSIDTSGNYSSTYDSITLTNGAPTAPTVTTDYIGRDCIVKWGASPDLDFSKWVLTIYSDAARTMLKRTAEMQSPGFIYTYDQIRADFGGAGVPGTIYFRIVTHDRFGSTTTTDFSATQASPAIVQYDGGSVERVRIGDLGSGAYGARFKDAAGNITFEQGDTLKQKYMKIDSLKIVKGVTPFQIPFAADTTDFMYAACSLTSKGLGTYVCATKASNQYLYAGEVGPDCRQLIDLGLKVSAACSRPVIMYNILEDFVSLLYASGGSIYIYKLNTSLAGLAGPTSIATITNADSPVFGAKSNGGVWQDYYFIGGTNNNVLYYGRYNWSTHAVITSATVVYTFSATTAHEIIGCHGGWIWVRNVGGSGQPIFFFSLSGSTIITGPITGPSGLGDGNQNTCSAIRMFGGLWIIFGTPPYSKIEASIIGSDAAEHAMHIPTGISGAGVPRMGVVSFDGGNSTIVPDELFPLAFAAVYSGASKNINVGTKRYFELTNKNLQDNLIALSL